jgi:hypothetical protein
VPERGRSEAAALVDREQEPRQDLGPWSHHEQDFFSSRSGSRAPNDDILADLTKESGVRSAAFAVLMVVALSGAVPGQPR